MPSPVSDGRLVLASASPQRRRILEEHGVAFVCHPANIEEHFNASQTATENAIRLATEKAEAVFDRTKGCCVLGADTIVVTAAGDILGKPADLDEAREMLAAKRGSVERVITGYCFISPNGRFSGADTATVRYRLFSETELQAVLDSREWEEVAGALRIEGGAQQRIIAEIDGDLENIIGLPYYRLSDALVPFQKH